MRPKLTDLNDWYRAELLMQPAFLRTIDNIRKQLESSGWKGTYEEFPVFPYGTSEEIQTRVTLLQQELTTASGERAAEITAALDDLPQPYPGYWFTLEHDGQSTRVDVWELCYSICFRDYQALSTLSAGDEVMVTIDLDLIGEDGDVDWHRLDEKAQRVVAQVFDRLANIIN
ncbi:MAG: hypothetical protein VKL01_12125 [Limnothrix sp.]|nr:MULTISPECIES: hypothetical protein [unclassified Limnothrix]MBD2554740.1 hypothetical protein [Limnothrix sp. FACHB-708]MBD2591947.1 hypothetical protein [Limnothrix sp. FACHB-406]MBD2636681.1 hypothetical protein [Limnothrix sp. FACHB-881]MEB3119107.1 hypothetical protein [Limnothrix sp.]OCQ93964.1 hypothetical protein BCR12_05415 [Limnothrix sp. P13C2]